MSTTSNTAKDLYDHLKFLTGQDSLSTANANRLFKYAVDDYSSIALTSDGFHKFDDLAHGTYPISTSTVTASNSKIQLDPTFLMLDRVTVTEGGIEYPLTAIDRYDYKDKSLAEVFSGTGRPTHYDYDAHGIEVFPHADQTYTVTAYHSRAAKYIDVTDDTTEIGIPRVHHFYLILHACRQLGFRTIDGNRTDISNELVKWEGQEINGRTTGGKIREFYAKRDEDRPSRIIGIVPTVFKKR